MRKTEKYQLPQWEMTDRIMMRDFNEMCQNIEDGIEGAKEEAKSGDAAIRAELGSIGHNLRVETGSYVGDGNYGAGRNRTLQFTLTPLAVIVAQENAYNIPPLLALYPSTGSTMTPGSASGVSITWGDHSISWCSSNSALCSANVSGATYHYAVLGY